MLKKPNLTFVKRQATVGLTPAMQIQYNGSALYGGAIATSGDLVLYADDTDGATTAVLTLDLTTPAAGDNTWGKVLAKINALSGWRAFLIGVKPSDPTDTSIVNITSAAVKAAAGITLLTTANAATHYRLGDAITAQEYRAIVAGKDLGDVINEGYIARLTYLQTKITFASGTPTIKVYSINDLTGVETVVWSDNSATSTTDKPIKFQLDYGTTISGKPGERLLVQVANSTGVALTVAELAIAGYMEWVGP